MHLPDGFLDTKTAALTAALAVAGVGLALRRAQGELPPSRVPLLGLGAAFLFVAQMVNFPVVGGTSGHLLGGTLVAALLGPSAGVVVLTTVLIVQCFLFADGGVLALGANVVNLALLQSAGGYSVYRLVSAALPGLRGRVTGVAFGGWCATVLSAIACAGQLAWSGTVAWPAAFTAMVGTHLLIGLAEGLIGALVFLGITRLRPDWVGETAPSEGHGGWRSGLGWGLGAILGAAVFVAPFACPWPDGLDSVATRLGFADRATGPVIAVPAPDYQVPGLSSAATATALAAAGGALIVFGLAWVLGRLLARETEGAVGPDPRQPPRARRQPECREFVASPCSPRSQLAESVGAGSVSGSAEPAPDHPPAPAGSS